MKRIFAAFLAVLLLIGAPCMQVIADEAPQEGNESLTWGVDHIYATFLDETVDVKDEIFEIDGGFAEPIHFRLDYTDYVDLTFGICQMMGKERLELVRSDTPEFDVYVDKMKVGWPVYLEVYAGDTGALLGRSVIAMRINKSKFLEKVPEDITKEFNKGIVVDMSHLVPGMELNVLPFLIPVTSKTYADGRVRIGIGYNSSDAAFWEKAAAGDLPEAELKNNLREIFYGNPNNLNAIKTSNMGVVILISGWAEGNVNTNEPIKGHMEAYIGTGFMVSGQYSILTWDLTVEAGATGNFDFSFVYNEKESEYNFQTDKVLLGVKGGLSLYGGIGCTLASIGIYGAGSIEYQEEMYPNPKAEHLILAGELGAKAKLFGKTLFSFKVISGKYDFVFEKKKSSLLDLDDEALRQELLSSAYADNQGVLLEAGKNFTWHGTDLAEPAPANGTEPDRDFAHILASDIYHDSQVQVVSTTSTAFPEMVISFLGIGQNRQSGNGTVLMSSYYNESTSFVSDPAPVNDDGTADYDPVLYSANGGKFWVVWKNANAAVKPENTFAEIASMTDLEFSERIAGNSWGTPQKVTNLAGSGKFATGARIGETASGVPVVAYYTNATSDPAGLDGAHEIYTATRDDLGNWSSTKVAEVNGTISQIDVSYFGYTIAVSASWTENGVKKTAIWRDGNRLFEKDNTSTGFFMRSGFNSVYFTFFENGRIKKLDTSLNEEYLTPEGYTIGDSNYQIFGKLGSSSVLIVSKASINGTGNAFGYVSRDGGHTWADVYLTRSYGYSYVSHISAAFDKDNSPVLLYSIQNYVPNVDLDNPTGESESELLIGADDERFTDTTSDLYISAGDANRHMTIVDAKCVDVEKYEPGKKAKITVTIKNTGLGDVNKTVLLCDGEKIAEFKDKIAPGEEVVKEAEIALPNAPVSEAKECMLEITTRDNLEVESRMELLIEPGYLTAKTWHSFRLGKESIKYEIHNYGYTDKKARIIVRDEINDVTLQDKNVTVNGAYYYKGEFEAKGNTFSDDGYSDVTIYVLFEGEDVDSPAVSLNRVKSIVPLGTEYGQSVGYEDSEGTKSTPTLLLIFLLSGLGLAVIAFVIYLILRGTYLGKYKKSISENKTPEDINQESQE